MLDGNILVAMSASDDQCEETNVLNMMLQMESRRAKSWWPAAPCWLLERVLFRHTASAQKAWQSLPGIVLG